MAQWIFPSNNNGQISGIADSGVETFRGTPIRSLAREICQNSLDAVLDPEKPAKVEFSVFDTPSESVPGIDSLMDVFQRGLTFWQEQSSENARKFYSKAFRTAVGPNITYLRISDFNTTGLTGSDALLNTPWCNLIKSSGASDKSSSSGGSFGIGKFAPFACSALRTVYYSTCDKDGHAAGQGVSRLTSFRLSEDDISQGVGYYGQDKCQPMYEPMMLDPAFNREADDYGTDIFITGFMHDGNWKTELIVSILDSFLLAVYRGKLIVDVDGTVIDRDHLPNLMEQYSGEFQENADYYYSVLTAGEDKARSFETDILGRGKVTLKLMIQPGFHRKCAMVRKTGMKILDKGNISSTIPFAGVLFIEGEELNSYLRSIENPQHTKWEPERSENKPEAGKLVKALRDFVSDSLQEMASVDSSDAIDPSVGEFLAFITERENGNQQQERREAVSDLIKKSEIKPVQVPKKENQNSGTRGNGENTEDDPDGEIIEDGPPNDKGSGGMNGDGTGGGGGGGIFEGEGAGPNEGENDGAKPAEIRKSYVSIASVSARQYCTGRDTGEYVLLFKPAVSGTDGIMKIYQSAESEAYEAQLKKVQCTQDGKVMEGVSFDGHQISGLTFTAGRTIRIQLTIDYHDYSSLEVKAYARPL